MKQSNGFVLISALIALVVVSSLAAINLSKAQNELKLGILQKDGFNAMIACLSAQKVAIEYLNSVTGAPSSRVVEVNLADGRDNNFNPLQKNPSFEISGSSPNYQIETTCYGSEKNIQITTSSTYDKSAGTITDWHY